jgi:predicted RNA-binding protein YlxR (DUF448 family)
MPESELDAGAKSPGAERFCALERKVRPAEAMIRFVVGPDGTVVPDLKRNLPGRGLWITATRKALAEAVRRKVFARGFRAEVKVAPDFAAFTERLLEKSVLDALAIAGKAGLVVSGYAKVENAVASDDIVALLHACDGAPDGIRKLDAALRRRFAGAENPPPVIGAFTTAQLDLALGRSNVVHAALLAGPASDGFLARFRRLARFRADDASDGTLTAEG